MSKILMRSVVVACLLVLLAPLSAIAQYGGSAARVPGLYDNGIRWDGGWVGVYGGAGWGRSSFNEPAPFLSSDSYNINGGVFGVSGAYIMRYGESRVYGGINVDFGAANLHGTATTNCTGCETKVTSFGTLRYVVGYGIQVGIGMLYPNVSGGLGFGNAKASVPALPGVSETKVGWALGAGVDYQFHKSWSIKAEYLYSDLGNLNCAQTQCGGAGASVPVKVNTLRLGLNYQFAPRY